MAGLFKLVLHSYTPDDPSNEFINVFGYRSFLAVSDEAQSLAETFEDQVVPAIANVISTAMRIARIEVLNVTDGVGYWDQVITPEVAGTRTGEFVSSFVAWSFKYHRVEQGKRHGYKRFGEISETDTFGNVPAAGVVDELNTLATVLGSPLLFGIIETWFPVILERKPTGVYPWTSHDVLNVSFQRITSQNSRKR